MDLTTKGLIDDIKLSALLPDGMYEDDDLIAFLNDGYYSEVLPFIMRHREDFYVTYTDFEPAASIAIPSDAIAQKLKDVQVKRGDRFYNLPRLSPAEMTTNNYSRSEGFYLQDNSIIFFPSAQTNTVRVVYFKRPHYMEDSTIDEDSANVDSSTVYTITTDTVSTTVYVSPNPAANISAGTNVNFTHSKHTQPFEVVDDITLEVGTSGNEFIAPSIEIATSMTTGDYLCNPGYTAFPKIPLEAREILVQAAVVKAMISMKDKDGYSLAQDQLKEAKINVSGLISPRIDNETKKIVNTSGLWRQSGRRR